MVKRSQPGLLWAALCVAAATVSLSGCATAPLAKRTTSFAAAATAATRGSASAYRAVEDTFYQARVASLVVNFDKNGFDPASVQPFLSADDLRVRNEVLDRVRKYAELLAMVSGDKPFAETDTGVKTMAPALQAISQGDLKSLNASPAEINIVVTALDALGRVLVERKRRRDLPDILNRMKEPMEQICSLLQQDIGDPQRSGLRNQLHNDSLRLVREQQQFIRNNQGSMSAAEKRSEIELLPRLVSSEIRADRALAATQKALGELAAAHTALVLTAGQKDAPAFRVQMSELIDQVQQIKTFYISLPTE